MGFVGVLSFETLPCEHTGETYPVYARIESEDENKFKHSVTVCCSVCDAAIGTEEDEVCVELDNTDVCGKCEAIMICEHQNQTTTGTRVSGWEKHTKVVNCDLCKVQIGESVTEACSDADADGVCDICKSYVTLNGAAVIYSGTGWPYSGYYVAKLTLSGADVLYTDGTTVYLEADTAEDAELSFEVTAGGSSSGNLGINWNDVAENTKTYTTSLVDGEATVKVYAYKASGSGVSRNGTQTFTIKIHECADNDNDGKCDVCGGKTEVFVPVTGITLDQAAATIKVGEQVTLNATIEPENATNSTIIWESEDPGVATVENGVVTGRGKGMVTITAKIDGKSAECVVAVVVPITEINFWDDGDNPMSEIVAPIGEEVDAVACCTPGITTDNRVLFESSNTEIFIVAEDDHEVMANDAGHAYVTIIGQKAGEATLTATSKTNPAVTATLKVIVPCNHADSERTYEYQYTPNNDETHAVVTKEYCADCETFIKETEVLSADCVDEGKDGTCDLCKGAVKVETPVVSGPWDGTTLSEPAQVDGVYQIGSGAELAWFAQKADAASKAVLTADIDLNNKTWTPMSKLSGSFDGQGYTVKNLNGSNGLFTTVAGASNSARAEVRNVTVEGSISSGVKMAGIAGTAYYANFTNCHNKASVSGSSNVGGIVGYVYQSASNGAVTLEKCSNTGSITGTGNAVGGIVGYGKANTNIYNCYNSGSVKGKGSVASSGLTGGIAGYLQSSTVTNCYNIGNIDGSGNYAGGLFGAMYNGVTATNCYNAGTVTGGSDKIGAIAAYAYNATNSKAVNCYYLEGTCSVAATNKTNAVDAGTTVKTDAELRSTEMLNLLGDAYKRSSSYPALTWESVSAGATEYSVTFIETEGVTFAGEAVAYSTVEYDFTVTINEGYYATDAFAVKVNGETVEGTQTGDKTYAYVVAAASDLAITVEGVESTDISLAWPEDMIGIEMTAKDVVTVTADCPAGAEVVFTSDNESVFTVETAEITADENGKATVQIKAVGAGDATLTATAKVNEDIKITANVHVNPYPYVLFDSSKHGAWSGTGYTLSKVIVTGVDVYSYEWENGTCIVRLTEDTDPNAVITFKAEGITGSNGNGAMYVNNDMYNHTVQLVNGEARANVKLAMKDHIDNLMSYRDFVFIPQDAPIIPVVSITITASADSMRKGEPVQLTAHILPENATNRGVTWTVNTGNTNATITEDGKLSAGTMGMGSTYTVTATSKANPEIKATYKIYHDYSLETSITMSKDTLEVKTGETATLSATITGEQFVTDTSVSEWKTADENIATVSGGRVTGVNPGTTTITAVSRHGLEATCEVTVICGHVNRETIKEYEQIEGQEKHTTVTYCACEDKPVLSTVAEACVDTDKDGACDFCKGEVAKKKGDMNGSGEVTTEDAEDVLAAIAAGEELTAEQIAAADMNGDGKLNAIDAVLILQAANN